MDGAAMGFSLFQVEVVTLAYRSAIHGCPQWPHRCRCRDRNRIQANVFPDCDNEYDNDNDNDNEKPPPSTVGHVPLRLFRRLRAVLGLCRLPVVADDAFHGTDRENRTFLAADQQGNGT
jgi:hypothetical protein